MSPLQAFSAILPRFVYAYKLVEAGLKISGNWLLAGSTLFRVKLVFWYSRIVLALFRVLITPVFSV